MGAYCCSSQEPTRDDFSIENEVKDSNVVVFSKPGCTDSLRAKTLLYSIDALPKVIEVNKRTYYLKEKLKLETKQESFPYVFIAGKFIGGYEELQNQINKGTIQKMLKDENNKQTQ
ncbi:unnamed protein product [Blepharisma stoltei]|uniref:Glutaredoxin domain-containing protein n=1 Tax=Blepharisma stoltei TaxID=1481888 RepID=A0AAU9JDZ3_9CILI|nr:unnamed protein product [Blepharisma stoltei]